MSLKIRHSNRVERLADDLAREMGAASAETDSLFGDFLSGETVLVDNPVLGSWINLQLALRNSVAANVDYKAPAVFLRDLAKACFSDMPEHYALDEEELTWRAMAALETAGSSESPHYAPVRNYLAGRDGDEPQLTDIKRYQLAAAVADLFDQYLVYRPNWFSGSHGWDSGDTTGPTPDGRSAKWKETQAWQRALWQEIHRQGSGEKTWHRAAVQHRLDVVLSGESNREQVQDALRKLGVGRLFVFGITSMPKAQFETLMRLGDHLDIHLYLLNPCREFWFDVRPGQSIARLQRESARKRDKVAGSEYLDIGNPLLASQSQQVQEFIELVYEHDGLEEVELFEDPCPLDEPPSLLATIQQDILDLQFRGEVVSLENPGETPRELPSRELDDERVQSIHFHDCHGPMREVEVLHDQLLDLFSRSDGLQPRDVVVMMPRVADYAPYIEAVFGGAPAGQRIPYHVTDRSLAEESPILNSFQTLLKLGESRLPLSEVLSVLEVPAVHRRFGMTRDDYDKVRQWLVEAGVRWGADAEHRESLGLPAYTDFSWEFGFNRLMAGYAMGGADTEIVSLGSGAAACDVAPFEGPLDENSERFDALIRFDKAITSLRKELRSEAGAPQRKNLDGWVKLLSKTLDDFYAPVGDEHVPFTALRKEIQKLEKSSQFFTGAVPPAVIREAVDAMLARPSKGRHPWSEGVKFCSLLPMRGVPFRVVYLLGMNLEDYPRQRRRPSFDLMQEDWQRGDRSARTDDRWLFLEALLSARDAFHVSFVGRSIHRNEKLQPSVLVSELLDYIRDGYHHPEGTEERSWPNDVFDGRALANESSFLHTLHPLQPYSAKYFVEDPRAPRLRSFKRDAWRLANSIAGQGQDADPAADSKPGRWEPPVADQKETLEITPAAFVRFFEKPWDAWSQEHGIRFEELEDQAIDDEPLDDPNALEKWSLKDRLLQQARRIDRDEEVSNLAAKKTAMIDRLLEQCIAEGAAPLGMAREALKLELDELGEDFLFATYGPAIEEPIRLRGLREGIELVGHVQRHVEHFSEEDAGADAWVLAHTPSKARPDKVLRFYLNALLCACGMSAESRPGTFKALFLGKNGGIATEAEVSRDVQKLMPLQLSVPADDDAFRAWQERARETAGLLLAYWSAHHRHGFLFHPDLSLVARLDESTGESKLPEKARIAWQGAYGSPIPGLKDKMAESAFYGEEAAFLSETFKANSVAVWASILGWIALDGGQRDE